MMRDEDWPLSTDYDGQILCEACDIAGVLFAGPECWEFTVTQLLARIAEHRKTCRKRTDAR